METGKYFVVPLSIATFYLFFYMVCLGIHNRVYWSPTIITERNLDDLQKKAAGLRRPLRTRLTTQEVVDAMLGINFHEIMFLNRWLQRYWLQLACGCANNIEVSCIYLERGPDRAE